MSLLKQKPEPSGYDGFKIKGLNVRKLKCSDLCLLKESIMPSGLVFIFRCISISRTRCFNDQVLLKKYCSILKYFKRISMSQNYYEKCFIDASMSNFWTCYNINILTIQCHYEIIRLLSWLSTSVE